MVPKDMVGRWMREGGEEWHLVSLTEERNNSYSKLIEAQEERASRE